MNYHRKYIKYKQKYLSLRHQYDNKIKQCNANNQFTINLVENLEGASNVISPLSVLFGVLLFNFIKTGSTEGEISKQYNCHYHIDELPRIYEILNNESIIMHNFLMIDKKIPIETNHYQKIKSFTHLYRYDENTYHNMVNKINSKIEYYTDGAIKNTIQKVDPCSHMIINILYFKKDWYYPFDPQKTSQMYFHHGNTLIDVMYQVNYFSYFENDKIQLIEIPFNDQQYVMGIILPRHYLNESELNYSVYNVPIFSLDEINQFINQTQTQYVELFLPKFTHHKKYSLEDIMKKMNLLISSDPKQLLIHETYIIIDELGPYTEHPQEPDFNDKIPITFKANHTFIYYVRHLSSNLFIIYGDYQGSH